MAVPVGETVHVDLASPDVIHALYVPQFLFKRDVVPGQNNHFDFTVDAARPARPSTASAPSCAAPATADALRRPRHDPADFDAWLADQSSKANATPPPRAERRPTAGARRQSSISAAQNIAFDQTTLKAPADAPFAINFNNEDAGVPHDIDDPRRRPARTVFKGQRSHRPGGQATYAYQPLPAGTYTFFCSVHPNMTGTLTVQ